MGAGAFCSFFDPLEKRENFYPKPQVNEPVPEFLEIDLSVVSDP